MVSTQKLGEISRHWAQQARLGLLASLSFSILFTLPACLSSQTAIVTETCLTSNEADDRYGSYSPNGEEIVFESMRDGNWEIYVMRADGENTRRLTMHDGDDRRPSWHPSGRSILFESDRSGNNQFYSLELASLSIRQLTDFADGEPIFGRYSPDGNYLAISLTEAENQSSILLVDADGEVVQQLTDNAYRNYSPQWSPDGQEIVYFSRKDTDNEDDEIYRNNIETGKEVRLTDWPKHNFCPAWSADGERIVYVTSMEGSRPEIYIMNRDGSDPIRLTENEDGETLPCWSPDGRKVLVTAYRNGNYELCELEIGEE